MARARGRKVAKKDVPVDVLRIVAQNACCLREAQVAHCQTLVTEPSSGIDTPPILDPPFPTSPMLDPVQLSAAMNNPFLPGSASHFDPQLPIACRPLTPSFGISTCRHALGP